jgi:hypothetical protein
MSEAAFRLPARPSLEQLRKQAKELLRDYRAGDTAAARRVRRQIPRLANATSPEELALADAQFVLAREYGFESWAALARHVAAAQSPRLDEFERLALELVAAYTTGDFTAIREINWRRGTSFYWDREPVEMQRRLLTWFASETRDAALALADARLMVARQFDAESWADLVATLTERAAHAHAAATEPATPSPFYRINREENAIAVRRPLSEKEWDAVFGVMREMRLSRLDAGPITDAALARLSTLDHLTCLNLDNATRFSDDGLLHLARMPQLKELDLSGWRSPITDRGLELLSHLPELRTFKMCWPQHVSDAGVANLTFCDHLESVDLLGTPTGDGAIAALTGKPKLRRFKTGRLVTDAGLPLLHHFPAFKTWQGGEIRYGLMAFDSGPTDLLLDGPFTSQGLAGIAGLDGLFGLSFFWHTSALTADGLEPLAELPNLGFLGCQGELCNDEAMRHIAAIPRLRMLMGQGTVAGDDGFAALSRSQTIEYIWGRECPNLKGRGFAALAAMPALAGLAVSCKHVGDAALSTLPRFPALRELMPMDVTDDGFRHLGRCERLEALWCMYCDQTGDIATGHIAGLTRLKRYYAGDTRITDRSLEILGRMSSLETLSFWQCAGITNAGVAVLARLPRLRELVLDGLPKVTREVTAVFPAGVRVKYSA